MSKEAQHGEIGPENQSVLAPCNLAVTITLQCWKLVPRMVFSTPVSAFGVKNAKL